jgi:hypothetical protein
MSSPALAPKTNEGTKGLENVRVLTLAIVSDPAEEVMVRGASSLVVVGSFFTLNIERAKLTTTFGAGAEKLCGSHDMRRLGNARASMG